MRNYAVALVALSTFFAFQGHTEFRFGAVAGGNFTDFNSGVDTVAAPNGVVYAGRLGPSGLFGYQIGGKAVYDQEKWAIESGLIYTNRSAQWHGTLRNGSNELRTSYEITLRQLEVPLIGFYKLPMDADSPVEYRFGIGLYAAYGFGKVKMKASYSNVPGSVASQTTEESWKKFGLRQFNFGGLVAFGADFKVGEKSKLGVELRGQTGFNDMADKQNPTFSGDSVNLSSVDLLVSYLF